MTKCPIRMGEIHRAAGKQAKLFILFITALFALLC